MRLQYRIFFTYSLVLFIITGLVIGVSIYYFNKRNTEFHQNKLKEKEQEIKSNIYHRFAKLDDVISTESLLETMDYAIYEIYETHRIHINFYDLSGNLLLTSILNPEKEGIQLHDTISNNIINKLSHNKSVTLLEDSKDQVYLSTYSYLFSKIGQPIAVLNLPYGYKQSEVFDNVYDFFLFLLPWYTIILAISLILSYWLSSYITRGINHLLEKIKHIDLESEYTPIIWDEKDEIGNLVSKFNDMQDKLTQSIRQLSLKNKEEAWQEMAKQVAHEIKNPLTPMKLSIQSFQYKFSDIEEPHYSVIKKHAEILLNQIDAISRIVDTFSNFAKMPIPQNQDTDLLQVTHDLAYMFADSNVSVVTELDKVFYNLDKSIFERILINILKNSTQAEKINEKIKIKIEIYDKVDRFEFSIKDNGVGIETTVINKIFEPKFTTKSTGTGIGLPMVKKLLEMYNSSIEVFSKVGVGTTVIIKLKKQ